MSLSNSAGRVGEGVRRVTRQYTNNKIAFETESREDKTKAVKIEDKTLLIEYATASVSVARAQATVVIKMLAANIAALNAVATACILNQSSSSPFMMLGDCQDGFLWNLLVNGLPFVFMDLFEIAYFISHVGLPLYDVYFLLDPFIVVAVPLIKQTQAGAHVKYYVHV